LSKRVLYVATVVKTHIMHFHIPYLKMFKERGWHTAVAARNDYEEPSECSIPYCDDYFDIAFERSPLKLSNIKAYRNLKRIIEEGNYDIVHCHTPVAAMLTRFAARKARKRGTKVLYTAHGFHFFKGAPLLNWLIYFPAEWLCSFMTDVLITINQEDFARAKKWMHAKRIEYVPGVGIALEKHERNPSARFRICKETGIDETATILLSVGELIERKNHQLMIRALEKASPELNIHYLIAGDGPMKASLMALAKDRGVEDRVHCLGYRTDVSELYSSADAFVFPSYQEGLSVALMEAMWYGLPCIVSRIRGNVDLLDNNGGSMFDPRSVDELSEKLEYVLNADMLKMGRLNHERIKSYSVDSIMKIMERIYEV